MESVGLACMTLGISQYGIIPLFADFNRTHATNPRWPAHARFHSVAGVLTTSAVAIVALILLWVPVGIEPNMAPYFAAVVSGCIYFGFFLASFANRYYDGAMRDIEGGIPQVKQIDLNTLNYGLSAFMVTVGLFLL